MRFARSVVVIVVAVVLAISSAPLPARAAGNQAPVAVDDPAHPGCSTAGMFGDAFPIPEDYIGTDPNYPGWFPLFGACSPLANDTDADGDHLTVEIVTPPAHGEALVVPNPPNGLDWLVYKVAPDYSTLSGDLPGGLWASDSVQYRAFDGQAYSNVATYTFWLAAINDAPSFTPGAALITSSTAAGPVSVPWATNITAGPPNEAYQSVTFEIQSVNTHGAPGMFAVAPAIDPQGTLTFTPGAEPGLATVTVDLHDDGGLTDYGLAEGLMTAPADTSATAEFQIAVDPQGPVITPGPPTAATDHPTVDPGVKTCLPLLDNDTSPTGVPFLITSFTPAAHGMVALAPGSCRISYESMAGYSGEDAFTYTITDQNGLSATGNVNVTVLPPPPPENAAPVAADDSATVAEGSAATSIDVLGNDTDADLDTLSLVSVTTPGHGTAAINGTKVDYTPAPGYVGNDSFDYTISDGHGHEDSATVSLTVSADTTPPVVSAVSAALPTQTIGASVSVRLAWTATDAVPGVASTQLQVSKAGAAFTNVALGSATATSASVTLTPGTSYAFRSRATDGRGNASDWQVRSPFVVKLAQESSGGYVRSGTWSIVKDAHLSGRASRRATAKGAKVTYSFSGRTIAWVGTRGSKGGRAQIRIDGVLVATVDTHAGSTSYRRTLFAKTLASGGSHKIELRVLGDGFVDLDAFVVLP